MTDSYILRHYRRTTPAVLESVDWYSFRVESDELAVVQAQARIAAHFDARTDYAPLWRGVTLIWEEGTRA